MKPIHRLPLLILTIILSTTTAASSSCAATPFVKSTCNSTTYPDLCNQVSLPYATKIKCDVLKMSSYALKAALVVAKKTVANISKDSSGEGAVEDCIALAQDGVAQIKDSLEELKALKNASSDGIRRFKLSNIKTWMSAALTDYQTCLDGLDEQEFSATLKGNITNSVKYSSKHSSNSLSIINQIQI